MKKKEQQSKVPIDVGIRSFGASFHPSVQAKRSRAELEDR